MARLGLRNEMALTDNLLVFQRRLEKYVLQHLDKPGDIPPLVTVLINPVPCFMKSMTTIKSLMINFDLDPDKAILSAEESQNTDIEGLMETENKSFITRKSTLKANIPKLCGIVWG